MRPSSRVKVHVIDQDGDGLKDLLTARVAEVPEGVFKKNFTGQLLWLEAPADGSFTMFILTPR